VLYNAAMSHRSFVDESGRKWDAWTVVPTKIERRLASVNVPEERRAVAEPRVRLAGAMADGWLCFETANEKRRLAPFPASWERMTDGELCTLCGTAELAPQSRRAAAEG
jgi:hypothetical protein